MIFPIWKVHILPRLMVKEAFNLNFPSVKFISIFS